MPTPDVAAARQRVRNADAANRLRKGFAPGDVQRIQERAEQRAQAHAAARLVRNKAAALRLSRIETKGFVEKLRDAFRAPEERLERTLTERFSAAKSIADGVAPEPDWLLAARHAKADLQRRYGKAWMKSSTSWEAFKSLKGRKPSWAFRPLAYRRWKREMDRLRAVAVKASDRTASLKERRDVAQWELESAERRWKDDPSRKRIEEPSKDSKFEAMRELKLIGEIRRMVKQDPLNGRRSLQDLADEAAERIRKKDYEERLKRELRPPEPGGAGGPKGP